MSFLCKLGIHRYRPVRVFATPAGYWAGDGHECQCGARKVALSQFGKIVESRQEAYDWLNEQENRPKARILELAKR